MVRRTAVPLKTFRREEEGGCHNLISIFQLFWGGTIGTIPTLNKFFALMASLSGLAKLPSGTRFKTDYSLEVAGGVLVLLRYQIYFLKA